ncbi:hypothetical protein [Pseudomonas abietaniphila]|uniref:hypothetical protein n=1 Tax=Pseudomonas abietaniphila TaxID=89065 RepID=UPI001FC91222|nr:hypothetical protein [Pseudomonas abietaniphila]
MGKVEMKVLLDQKQDGAYRYDGRAQRDRKNQETDDGCDRMSAADGGVRRFHERPSVSDWNEGDGRNDRDTTNANNHRESDNL